MRRIDVYINSENSWSPDPSTVCAGESFPQTSNCGTTRAATGSRNCNTGGGGSTGGGNTGGGNTGGGSGGNVCTPLAFPGGGQTPRFLYPQPVAGYVYEGWENSNPTDGTALFIYGSTTCPGVKKRAIYYCPQNPPYRYGCISGER